MNEQVNLAFSLKDEKGNISFSIIPINNGVLDTNNLKYANITEGENLVEEKEFLQDIKNAIIKFRNSRGI
jgi:hypothetical protein